MSGIKWGIIFEISLSYHILNENRYCVSETDNFGNEKFGIIDINGSIVCSFDYDKMDFYSDSIIGVALKDDKFNLINIS